MFWIGSLLLACTATLLPSVVEAQVALSPRIVWMDSYLTPRRSVMTGMLGIRVDRVGTRWSPFSSLFWRGTEASFTSAEPPPSDGFHAVLGLSVRGGAEGNIRPHASLGAGVVFWRNANWGNKLLAELEAGFNFHFSEGGAITVAGRVERMPDEPTLLGISGGLWFRLD